MIIEAFSLTVSLLTFVPFVEPMSRITKPAALFSIFLLIVRLRSRHLHRVRDQLLQQVAFRVTDVDVAADRLREAGLRLLYVTITRATQSLTIVHAAPLPEGLTP